MQIFFSAGEPSGDIHGANLIRTLHGMRPDLSFVGFGGECMAAAGCRLHYPLAQTAIIGFVRVLGYVPSLLELLARTDRYFRHQRPDAVVLIDYPGFNWWVARRAHLHRIPVYWFVPPQIWAWASWRVRRMQRWVDHVLCTLPFEQEWYRQRGVAAQYIGHPFFDELPRQQLDAGFLSAQQQPGRPIIALLPGSRTQEVENNLPTLLAAASQVHAARPDVRFLMACFKESQRRYVAERLPGSLPIETHTGRTPEIIQLAHACVAVSGSVGLELLYRGKPTAVIYRTSPLYLRLTRMFMKCPYISLVNLLAEKELYPEFLSDRCEADGVAGHVLRWLNDPAEYARNCAELAALRGRVAVPGACEQAARYLLEHIASPMPARAA